MDSKQLTLIRILQLLKRYSDIDHPIKQSQLIMKLDQEYNLKVERKTIWRGIEILQNAGFSIDVNNGSYYIKEREFEDSELRVLIDCVRGNRFISDKYSKDFVDKIKNLSNKYFKVNNIETPKNTGKSWNKHLFFNVERVSEAMAENKQITFDFKANEKDVTPTKHIVVSPYCTVLHNGRYYLYGLNEKYKTRSYFRLDLIINMKITSNELTPKPKGESVDVTASPYLYTDKPEEVIFLANKKILSHINDWFGKEATIINNGDKLEVHVTTSLMAMKYWSLQYLDSVEVVKPESLRKLIKESLEKGLKNIRSKSDTTKRSIL